MKLISVRGSGDTLNTIGIVGVRISGALARRANEKGVDYGAYGLGYTAVGIDWWKLTAPATTAILFAQYQRSKSEGRDNLRALVKRQVEECPKQRLVLVGFSQGAHAVGDVLSRKVGGLTQEEAARIAAVALIADPRFNSREPFATGENLRPGRNGLLGARAPGGLAAVKGKVRSWCRRNDIVCQGLPARPGVHDQHEYFAVYGVEIVDFIATKLGWNPGRISAGGDHTCAVTEASGVKCWGSNDRGQLGDGTTIDRRTPVSVGGLKAEVVAVSAGFKHTCALLVDGAVTCWGWNGRGELGDGTTRNRSRPVVVHGLLRDLVAVSAGAEHTCALTGGGDAWCWGEGGNGQLGPGIPRGPGSDVPHTRPIRLLEFPGRVASLSAGGYHTCGISSAGGAYCWGNNPYGESGHGRPGSHLTPLPVLGLQSGVAQIGAGLFQTFALVRGGVRFWGAYGLSVADGFNTPVAVAGLERDVVAISVGEGGGRCAIVRARGVMCMEISSRPRALVVRGLKSAISLSAGGGHACALLAESTVMCWGRNDRGQLGDGTTKDRSAPVVVNGLE